MANTYNTKNYFAHGGEQLVIGGKLTCGTHSARPRRRPLMRTCSVSCA